MGIQAWLESKVPSIVWDFWIRVPQLVALFGGALDSVVSWRQCITRQVWGKKKISCHFQFVFSALCLLLKMLSFSFLFPGCHARHLLPNFLTTADIRLSGTSSPKKLFYLRRASFLSQQQKNNGDTGESSSEKPWDRKWKSCKVAGPRGPCGLQNITGHWHLLPLKTDVRPYCWRHHKLWLQSPEFSLEVGFTIAFTSTWMEGKTKLSTFLRVFFFFFILMLYKMSLV